MIFFYEKEESMYICLCIYLFYFVKMKHGQNTKILRIGMRVGMNGAEKIGIGESLSFHSF